MNNARPPGITAAAGTELPRAFNNYHFCLVIYRSLRHTCLLSFTKCRWVRISSIAQDSTLLPHKSSDLISVLMRLAVLSDQLGVVDLVSF